MPFEVGNSEGEGFVDRVEGNIQGMRESFSNCLKFQMIVRRSGNFRDDFLKDERMLCRIKWKTVKMNDFVDRI
jgi:hypothetical protein